MTRRISYNNPSLNKYSRWEPADFESIPSFLDSISTDGHFIYQRDREQKPHLASRSNAVVSCVEVTERLIRYSLTFPSVCSRQVTNLITTNAEIERYKTLIDHKNHDNYYKWWDLDYRPFFCHPWHNIHRFLAPNYPAKHICGLCTAMADFKDFKQLSLFNA